MIRALLLMALVCMATTCLASTVRAEDLAGAEPRYAEPLAADVFATALAFMAPRILDPTPMSQLALWGLRGLTALDPGLLAELRGDRVQLVRRATVLFARAPPGPNDARAWGALIAATGQAGWDASAAVRRAGMQGLIGSFFDEVFNHLDPYSRYAPPADATSDRARWSDEAGIGLTLGSEDGHVVVQRVAEGSPAAKAGIRAGERIAEVDGETLADDAAAAADLIAGPEDTQVLLRLDSRTGRARTVTATRAAVTPSTVAARPEADLLVLRITGFNGATQQHLSRAITHALARRKRPRGLVLDLRGNRGGLLHQAVGVAGTVLGTGLVATTAGRDPQATRVLQADGIDLSGGLPVVVIVDGRSASSAEIVAAALADDRRAVVVGSTTLGKGLIQTVLPLPDGGELFLTWSRVLAPLGWPIQGLGVMPQICTSMGRVALDRQLDGLAHGRQPMLPALTRSRTARAPLPAAQTLDIRAACPAAEGQEEDLRAARYLLAHPAAYQAALLPAQFLPPR